ncbi:hypothetical protein ACJMK2_025820 [Sinanodonta woodiana]|uniref:Nephrin n=1 Tax=Sinanodonta woodiana TaxID=1069815 RepID=A0ABD3XHP3_SINWO
MQGFDLIIRMDFMCILRTGWILISFYTVQVVCVQEFLEKPQNMSVVKGQTAVMKCSVQNRAGLVQWARDGLMLGYDRKIPGYSRYSMIGNNDQEYHLQIIDVNLSDDADLSCQVSPAVNNPPLVAMGHLTVLVPPNMPEIVDHANGSSIEVRYTDPVLQLTCIATNGRPAAMIKWYRGAEEQTNKVEYSVEPIPNDKRQNARSVITISPRYPEDNGIIYTCEARNEALIGGPLQVKVKLSVLYPPATPVITGYRLNEIVRTNDTMSLTCTSEGGNPLAQVVWFKNNEEIDFSYTQANNKAVNYLTFTAQPSDNNAEYRCEATNVVTPQPLIAKIKLIVHFAPKKVTISGDKLAKAGEVVTLSCQSANSNPAAAITWFAKGRQLAETTSRVEESPDGGFITYSEVTVTMTHQDNNIIYSCQATNEQLGQTVAATATLSVLYPPDPPQITGYTEGESIRAGDLKRMTCSAVGGNPLATLKWFKGDAELPAESPGPPVGNIATSEIAIVTKADDNGAIYKCTASNDATAVPLEAVKRLTVHFPPPSVGITTDPKQPKAGHKLTLTCISASSNPGAVITWINNNRRIQGIDKGMTPAEYGGKSTTNILEFVPTSEHHQAVYGCRATNLLLSETVNDAITLDVLYKPEFNDTISPTSIEIVEGTSKTVNFTVSANPSVVNYTLIKFTESVDASGLTLENGLLQIASIAKAATGSYGIVSENSEGSTMFNFSIAVLFPATIESPEKVEADVGTKAELKCKAVASPMTANMIKWTREGFDMTRTRESYQDGVGMLIIEELAKGDSGKFTCVADNGVGSAVTAEVELLVRFSPEIDKNLANAKAASVPGLTGRLSCKAEGSPQVSFKWKKDGSEIVATGEKYEIQEKVTDGVKYENILLIKEVSDEDYGVYVCIVGNSKGNDSYEIVFDGTDKPDPPYNIRFVNATHDSITIAWDPGFDGGLVQAYTVRYKPVSGSHGYVQIDVIPPGSTLFTVRGLELGTEYEFTVKAFNTLGHSEYQPLGIKVVTSNVKPAADENSVLTSGSEDTPVIIILVVCVVGIFLLALNIGLILFFVRRRKKRLENGSDTTSHTNTIELYGPSKETALYPMTPSDESRSYGTYDKNMEDFSDDYKSYEEEDVKTVFLPPPEYSSTTYSHNKLDSPTFEHHTFHPDSKQTYLDDLDESERKSPWRYEDSSRGSRRYKGTFDNNYADDHIRENGVAGMAYDVSGRTASHDMARQKSVTDMSDRLASRPSSRGGYKTPPPPPVRSSSKGAVDIPPLPSRNYAIEEASPRYVPPPGSLSSFRNNVNVVPNPSYNGPPMRVVSPHSQGSVDDMRGHLV